MDGQENRNLTGGRQRIKVNIFDSPGLKASFVSLQTFACRQRHLTEQQHSESVSSRVTDVTSRTGSVPEA